MRMRGAPHPGFRLALAALLLGFAVVALGAFTRLVDAGLGCPDWPGCYGHLLWPDSPEEIAAANRRWPEAPVIAERTWPEMTHRYLAAALGALTLTLALFLRAKRRLGWSPPLAQADALLGLVIFQALLGMWTVTLKLWPQVVTMHLLAGFATLALLFLIVLRLAGFEPVALEFREVARRVRPWVILGLTLLVMQIAVGGWLSANYAAIACPDLPMCQGRWWPPADFAAGFNVLQSVGPNYLGGRLDNEARVAIHLAHRAMAVAVAIYVLLLCVALRRGALRRRLGRLSALMMILLAAQLALGLGNVWLDFPVWTAVAHNLGAAALLLSMVALLDALRSPPGR